MELTLYHFFPDRLNLYGDRGNIMVLKKRSEWRGIQLNVEEIKDVENIDLNKADILFIGGGSDREQALCTNELIKIKDSFKEKIEEGTPTLTICGGYQFLGNYYQTLEGEELKGLGIFNFHTVAENKRLIGHVLIESPIFGDIVGFENHSGRTYHSYETLGSVVKGYGNNDTDFKEGIVYKNLIGTYLHGPLLPRNPKIADFLIQKALEKKYGETTLKELDDSFEKNAKLHLWNQLT